MMKEVMVLCLLFAASTAAVVYYENHEVDRIWDKFCKSYHFDGSKALPDGGRLCYVRDRRMKSQWWVVPVSSAYDYELEAINAHDGN